MPPLGILALSPSTLRAVTVLCGVEPIFQGCTFVPCPTRSILRLSICMLQVWKTARFRDLEGLTDIAPMQAYLYHVCETALSLLLRAHL